MDKLKQAARQIIVDWDSGIHLYEAITALREALAEPVKLAISEEAFNWIDANAPMFVRKALAEPQITTPDVCGEVCARAKLCYGCNKNLEEANAKYAEQAEQEPVAYTNKEQLGYLKDPRYQAAPMAMWSKPFDKRINVSLYAAPVHTKDLTEKWIDPNDKSQQQYLPHIGEKILFCCDGEVYYGHHTGGAFQKGYGVTKSLFPTWDCMWMHLPAAVIAADREKNK